jgi:hypothetical protein
MQLRKNRELCCDAEGNPSSKTIAAFEFLILESFETICLKNSITVVPFIFVGWFCLLVFPNAHPAASNLNRVRVVIVCFDSLP